jgi:ribosomal protein S18 acetylase RimI-like enzyme
MEKTLIVRRGTAADLERCSEHWLAMFQEVGVLCEADFPPGWRGDFYDYFSRRMAAGEAAFFLAADEGTIAGTAGALLRDGYPAAVTGIRHGYIFGVHVDPEYRRRGIAELLTRRAIDYLEQSDCRNIRLHASRFGRSIYERIGFVATNEMELATSKA